MQKKEEGGRNFLSPEKKGVCPLGIGENKEGTSYPIINIRKEGRKGEEGSTRRRKHSCNSTQRKKGERGSRKGGGGRALFFH